MNSPQDKPLASYVAAIEAGYAEGALLRKNGARPEHLADNIDVYGAQFKRSPHYDSWLKAFRAGHLGESKPPT
jgi:hypothetical protein